VRHSCSRYWRRGPQHERWINVHRWTITWSKQRSLSPPFKDDFTSLITKELNWPADAIIGRHPNLHIFIFYVRFCRLLQFSPILRPQFCGLFLSAPLCNLLLVFLFEKVIDWWNVKFALKVSTNLLNWGPWKMFSLMSDDKKERNTYMSWSPFFYTFCFF